MNATPIICSECGDGFYYPAAALHAPTDADFACGECGHEISRRDLVLDEGEALTTDTLGRVSYTTEDEDMDEGECPTCGAESGFPCGHPL